LGYVRVTFINKYEYDVYMDTNHSLNR